jgi:hypothetical protein
MLIALYNRGVQLAIAETDIIGEGVVEVFASLIVNPSLVSSRDAGMAHQPG